MKTRKETPAQKQLRHAEIERIFAKISHLAAEGKLEEALTLRAKADRLRIYWK